MTIVAIILWFFGCVAASSAFMGTERMKVSSIVAGWFAAAICVVPFIVGLVCGLLAGGVALGVFFVVAKLVAKQMRSKPQALHHCPKCGSISHLDTGQFKKAGQGFLVCNDCRHQFSYSEGVWSDE